MPNYNLTLGGKTSRANSVNCNCHTGNVASFLYFYYHDIKAAQTLKPVVYVFVIFSRNISITALVLKYDRRQQTDHTKTTLTMHHFKYLAQVCRGMSYMLI